MRRSGALQRQPGGRGDADGKRAVVLGHFFGLAVLGRRLGAERFNWIPNFSALRLIVSADAPNFAAASATVAPVAAIAINCRSSFIEKRPSLRLLAILFGFHLQPDLDQAEVVDSSARRSRPLKLNAALFLNRRLLNSDHLAFHLRKLGRSLFVSADKEGSGPKDDDRRCRRQAIVGSLLILDAGQCGSALRNPLGFKRELLAGVLLVHDRRNVSGRYFG